MLQKILILLPEISLLSCLGVSWIIHKYRTEQTAKTFFTMAKFFTIISFLATVIFYNKSAFPHFWENTSYTTLFKSIMYLLALAWFYLSCKWFLDKNRSSYSYYSYAIFYIFLLGILISATHLLVWMVCLPLLCVLNLAMIVLRDDEEKITELAKLYAFFAVVFMLLMYGGAYILWNNAGGLDYATLELYLAQGDKLSLYDLAAITMIVANLLFMMAVAPFHTWFVDAVRYTILPVSGFLSIIPIFAYVSCLADLVINVFWPAAFVVRPMMLIFAFLSLMIGAFSANGERNIRQVFAFSTVFQVGFVLFTLVGFNDNSVLSAFVYLVVYVLAMAGVYTIFLSLKSRGEYLVKVEEVAGLSLQRPYIAAAFLLFIVSMCGMPPMLGFLGKISVINNLVIQERWGSMLILLSSLLVMINAYLQIIRSIYFEKSALKLDRTDKTIYICLFINILIVAISILNPAYLFQDAEKILNGVF